jgi:hypothetical protein
MAVIGSKGFVTRIGPAGLWRAMVGDDLDLLRSPSIPTDRHSARRAGSSRERRTDCWGSMHSHRDAGDPLSKKMLAACSSRGEFTIRRVRVRQISKRLFLGAEGPRRRRRGHSGFAEPAPEDTGP